VSRDRFVGRAPHAVQRQRDAFQTTVAVDIDELIEPMHTAVHAFPNGGGGGAADGIDEGRGRRQAKDERAATTTGRDGRLTDWPLSTAQ